MLACCKIITARLLLAFAVSKPCCSQARFALLRSAYSASPSGARPRPLLLPVMCSVRTSRRRESNGRSRGISEERDPHSRFGEPTASCAGRGSVGPQRRLCPQGQGVPTGCHL